MSFVCSYTSLGGWWGRGDGVQRVVAFSNSGFGEPFLHIFALVLAKVAIIGGNWSAILSHDVYRSSCSRCSGSKARAHALPATAALAVG